MADKAERFAWVDVAKGISIILVVMMHSAYGVGGDTGSAGYLHYVIGWATPFRMPEFFLISGLFLANVIGRDWLRYADRRVVHYLYFYALWAVLQIGFKVGLGSGDPLAAATDMAWAVIEPYGVLWFIYMLAVFSLMAKLLFELRANHWLVLAAGAALQIAPVHTGSYIVDQLAEYFVYFYAGYALASRIFAVVAWAIERPLAAVAGLGAYGLLNTFLVFGGGFELAPEAARMGYAAFPGLHLALALAGSLSVCVLSGLLSRIPAMAWLRWLGERSIVVYLSFAIPMAATRLVLLKLGLVTDVGVLSTLVLLSALVAPLLLHAVVMRTGWGRFLFTRPAWAHLPGAPGSRRHARETSPTAPAE